LHFEVLEDEKMLMLNTAWALAGALHIAHPEFDLNSRPTILNDLWDKLEEGLPYMAAAVSESGSAVERERQAFVNRFMAMHQRVLKDAVNENPTPKPEIKTVGKKNV